MEIQKTINELCSIKATRNANGQEQFKSDTQKTPEGKTVYLHKDRATALLLAMYLYKSYIQLVNPMDVMTVGGAVRKGQKKMMWEPISQEATAMNTQWNIFERANKQLQGNQYEY